MGLSRILEKNDEAVETLPAVAESVFQETNLFFKRSCTRTSMYLRE